MPKVSDKTKFIEFTGVSASTAQRYLTKNDNNLQRALDNYLSQSSTSKAPAAPRSKKLLAVFNDYVDPSNKNQIDINGTLKYLNDLEIEPEHPKALVLAYYLMAPSVGVFEKSNFLNQWAAVNVETIQQMKQFIDKFYTDVIQNNTQILVNGSPATFQSLYGFTFDFLMELQNQKLLDTELAVDYWKLLFPLITQDKEVLLRLDQWYDFVVSVYKRSFSKDSWTMFYLFVQDVVVLDPVSFSKYDEMASWPSVIDEYVEYLRENDLLAEKT